MLSKLEFKNFKYEKNCSTKVSNLEWSTYYWRLIDHNLTSNFHEFSSLQSDSNRLFGIPSPWCHGTIEAIEWLPLSCESYTIGVGCRGKYWKCTKTAIRKRKLHKWLPYSSKIDQQQALSRGQCLLKPSELLQDDHEFYSSIVRNDFKLHIL